MPPTPLAPVAPDTQEEWEKESRSQDQIEDGWGVIVWNDPINLMSYVVFVFKKVLKMSDQQAHKHMLEVHQRGKSLVAHETKERAELFVHQLQQYGLQATMEAL